MNEPPGDLANQLAGDFRRAVEHEAAGRLADAERLFSAILDAAPDHIDALHHLGLVAFRGGRIDEALGLLGRSIEQNPYRADFHSNAGAVLLKAGRADEALAATEAAIRLDPGNAHAHLNRSHALRALGRQQESIAAYELAIESQPQDAKPYIQLAGFLRELDRLDDAIAVMKRATEALPSDSRALAALCTLLEEADRPAEIAAALQRALALAPRDPDLFNRLGSAQYKLGLHDQAESAYRQAIRLDSTFAAARCNLGICLLTQERWHEGWTQYEWRRWARRIGEHGTHYRLPQWRGPGFSNSATLLLWSEQAIGDEIFYAGLVGEAARHASHVVLECESRLQPLFARSFPELEIVPRQDPPHPRAVMPDVTVQSPTGSLPRWFRRRDEDFPVHRGYLKADPARTAALRERYRAGARGPLIGLSWRSRNAHVGTARSIALDRWAPIFAVEGVTFVVVQYGDCAEELGAIRQRLDVTVVHDPTIDPLADMDGLAAQLAAMDLVISIDNSTVHLAGGLGKPAWVMLPKGAGSIWYWSLERDDSLWYPSLRLFRQAAPGDWAPVVARVAERLIDFVRDHGDETRR